MNYYKDFAQKFIELDLNINNPNQFNEVARAFNGIKFFNSDGSRNLITPFMLRWNNDIKFLEKENYNIIYS